MTTFDVIIVGAGSAGCALAARLSEDPARSVLLLESGHVPTGARDFPPELLDAGTVRGADPAHPDNWAFHAELVPGRPYSIARGRILGGSSTINGSYFIRARQEDFDHWATRGGEDWSWRNALQIYRSIESDLDFGSTAVHGASGPVPVSRAPLDHPVSRAFEAAAAELGFAAEPDKNDQGEAGYGPIPQNVHGGIRWNAGLAYITPILGRPNLTVTGDTTAVRVLFVGTRAVGVEVAAGRVIRATEVILCAGSVMTPRLLLASGIGAREQLERFGIPVVSDRPGVGSGFSDHPQVALSWRPLANAVDYSNTPWMAVGLNFDDFEIVPLLKPMGYLLSGIEQEGDLAMLISLQAETSRGTLTLASADPHDRPVIRHNYLSTTHDRNRFRDAVRTAIALLRSRAFEGLFGQLTDLPDETIGDDAALDGWIRANIGTSIHLCATAPMGPIGDPLAVVDGHGRVHGVDGLRVADTSILPSAPTRGPAATAILIGELVAGFVRRGD